MRPAKATFLAITCPALGLALWVTLKFSTGGLGAKVPSSEGHHDGVVAADAATVPASLSEGRPPPPEPTPDQQPEPAKETEQPVLPQGAAAAGRRSVSPILPAGLEDGRWVTQGDVLIEEGKLLPGPANSETRFVSIADVRYWDGVLSVRIGPGSR